LGSGSDVWKYWDEKRAGVIGEREWEEIENGIARSPGHCMTMGTASTMTAASEALGMTLPGASSIPAADSNHARMASASGRRIVEMVWEDLKPSAVLTTEAYNDAVTTVLALGGSTNAVIHLIAMARRSGVPLGLDRFDEVSRSVPVLANIRPSGEYLMEDFYYAGGLRGLFVRLKAALHLGRPMVNGRAFGENLAGAEVFNEEVIRPPEEPIHPEGGLAVLRGNLTPDGCVIKHSAADPRLLRHTGPAVVFDDYDDLARRVNDPSLDVDESSVLVLRGAGPLGAPGMPEWGMLPIPEKLLRKGVRDMVRISDARMSGTAYGTCVLHVAPESHAGGPLALVRTGDPIELDVPNRRLELLVDEAELERRRAAWKPPEPYYGRGYGAIFARHVTQANEGCDFDFLAKGSPIPEPEIH
jgi:dihydroxy-acid dehydratase